jgi:hypothetical protein
VIVKFGDRVARLLNADQWISVARQAATRAKGLENGEYFLMDHR